MWHSVGDGIAFSGSKDAFKALRKRAERAIAQGDLHGFEVRHIRVRLKDETGFILFEGTIGDAARLEIDGQVYLPALDTRPLDEPDR